MKTTMANTAKTLLMALLLAAPAAAHADGYAYLAFRQADSTCLALDVESLEMTFDAEGHLVATNTAGSYSLTVADLAAMFFTNDKTSTAIAHTTAAVAAPLEVYTLAGTRLGTFASEADLMQRAPKGVYVVRRNGLTHKMTIR